MLWVSPVLAGRTRPVSSSFPPTLNQAAHQTTADLSKNDEGRPLARKVPQVTPKKQRVKRDQDYLTQLKELDIPDSAKAARTMLVATLQDNKITCGQTFVDRVRYVCIWDKTRSKSPDAPKRGRRRAELPADVSRQFLRKSHIYFSSLATADTPAKKQAINTSCLTGLLPKSKAGIKRFLDFHDDDINDLAESGSAQAFSALNQKFPENLETFKDFIGLFGERENTIPRKYLFRFTSMHCGKGVKGVASRTQAFWDWLQGKGWEDDFASISGLLAKKGIPDNGNSEDFVAKELENFFDLFGEGESKIPRKYLSRFTSMHCSKGVKGLAPRAQAFWGWLQVKGWVGDFASISGLLTQQGIPDTGNNEDPVVKGLENFFELFGEGGNKIPRTHLSRFTSMHSGKGVAGLAPRAQAFWGWLQGKGWEADFASISGLLTQQRIPDTGNSADPVTRELESFFDLFGEGESKIPRKYVFRFTSIHSGRGVKGLAPQAQAFWGWLQGKGWVDDFASISGLLNRQGIPDTGNSADPVVKGLENFFDLFGEEENKIPRKYLSRFTSMHSGKGIKGLVSRTQAFWNWFQGKGWEDDFVSISGMLNQQGIPDTGNSADPVAKGLENFFDLFGEEGSKIPWKHLPRFTSMHCGQSVKELASRAKAFWGWLQGKGWVDGFASISGLLTAQGIPDTGNSADPFVRELENFFDLFGEGESKIPRKHLSRFTSMYGGKGVPPINQVLALWTWFDKDSVLLWQAARLFNKEGLPSLPTLDPPQNWLKEVTSWDGDDTMPLNTMPLNTMPLNTMPLNTVPLNTVPLKVIALHMGAPKKKRLTRARVTSFMAHQKGGKEEALAVITLARLLCRHGSGGVKAYQEMMDGDSPLDSYHVIKLLLKAASVDLARMAVTEILPETGFRGASHYLAVCRNMKPAPGLGEWTQVQRYIKTLIRAMTHQDTCSGEDEHPGTVYPFNATWKIQRLYIDALWTLSPTGRQRFLEVRSVQTLLRVVRSITALNQLARANQGDSFQQQCQACLNIATPALSAQDLENLFSLHLSLRIPWYQQHPSLSGGFCHASASAGASGTGVLIRPAPEHGDDGQKLWQPFAAAVVNGLNKTAFSRGKKGIFSLVCGEDEWVFDRPHLVFGDQGVTITNWTEEQYRLFGDAIELPGFEADDNSVPEPCVTTRQVRLVPQPATASTVVHQELSFELIERLLKSSVQLRPQIWIQLEHQRTSLPDSILGLLGKMQNRPDMPENLRLYVQAASREVTDTQLLGAMPDLALLKGFDITGNLVDDLLQPPVLTEETLKLLSPMVDDLTAVQLAEIIAKLDVNLPWDIREPWLEGQAKSLSVHQSNNDRWDLVEWLNADCDTIGADSEPSLDEFNKLSIVPNWGESETMDTFWGDLQEMD